MFRFLRLGIIFSVVVGSTTAWAVPLHEFSNGDHSFKSLGPNFYAEVPVRKIPDEDIQLVFVNYELAERLGIELPKDPVELEKLAKANFGWEVDPEKKSPKSWFATHYLDSAEKGPGEAMGDGRALWTGEIKFQGANGQTLYVDAVQKGVGQTPFAWLKNDSHSDGKQAVDELVNSAFLSRVNARNQLDSSEDLFGFRIHRGGKVTSSTLRLGNQTRVAHPSFHADNKNDFKKMMDYIVKRDLGLPLEGKVGTKNVNEWLRFFTTNIAEEAARFFDLDMIQESPTAGNKTSRGGTIDLAGVRYFDAYHTNYKHLFGRLNVGDQKAYMAAYLEQIARFFARNGYSNLPQQKLSNLMQREFKNVWNRKFEELTLNRLGLTAEEAAKIPAEQRSEMARAVEYLKSIYREVGVDMPGGNKNTFPAEFDTREVLKNTMQYFSKKGSYDVGADFLLVFDTNRSWAENVRHPRLDKIMTEYLKAAAEVGKVLSPKPLASWAEKAERVGHVRRPEFPKSDDFWEAYTGAIVEDVKSGKGGLKEISARIEQAADKLVDAELPIRSGGQVHSAPISSPASGCASYFSRIGDWWSSVNAKSL